MGTELDIGYGLVTLKLNIGEFLAVAKQIAGVTKAREELKATIGEIRKSCDTAVDVFTPLYALTTEAAFTREFGALHASFKNSYLKNADAIRTHCDVVKIHLDALLKEKQWVGSIPLMGRSYERLNELCQRWLFSDVALAEQMGKLLRSIDDLYGDLACRVELDCTDEAFALLRSCLAQFEDDFLSLRKQLNGLDVLAKTL